MSRNKSNDPESKVREIRRKTRRKYSAKEKIRIVLEGLRRFAWSRSPELGIKYTLYQRPSRIDPPPGLDSGWGAVVLGYEQAALTGVPQSVALAADLDDVRMMQQAVEHGAGHCCVAVEGFLTPGSHDWNAGADRAVDLLGKCPLDEIGAGFPTRLKHVQSDYSTGAGQPWLPIARDQS